MKNFKPFYILILWLFVQSHASAASGDSGGDSTIMWSCQSLQVTGIPGNRQSFCYAWSPAGALSALELDVSINGTTALNSNCGINQPYSGNQTPDLPNSGSTDLVAAAWDYPISYQSFADILNGYAVWGYVTWVPPNPSGGSASKGPYTNTVGNCF